MSEETSESPKASQPEPEWKHYIPTVTFEDIYLLEKIRSDEAKEKGIPYEPLPVDEAREEAAKDRVAARKGMERIRDYLNKYPPVGELLDEYYESANSRGGIKLSTFLTGDSFTEVLKRVNREKLERMDSGQTGNSQTTGGSRLQRLRNTLTNITRPKPPNSK